MEPADARNGSEHAESVDNECVKTASPSQSSATCVNRHVTKGGGTGERPAGNPASGGEWSCHPPCHAVTRPDSLLLHAFSWGKKATDPFVCWRYCIADSEVSFWFVMIIIINISFIVIIIIINIINIH